MLAKVPTLKWVELYEFQRVKSTLDDGQTLLKSERFDAFQNPFLGWNFSQHMGNTCF